MSPGQLRDEGAAAGVLAALVQQEGSPCLPLSLGTPARTEEWQTTPPRVVAIGYSPTGHLQFLVLEHTLEV